MLNLTLFQTDINVSHAYNLQYLRGSGRRFPTQRDHLYGRPPTQRDHLDGTGPLSHAQQGPQSPVLKAPPDWILRSIGDDSGVSAARTTAIGEMAYLRANRFFGRRSQNCPELNLFSPAPDSVLFPLPEPRVCRVRAAWRHQESPGELRGPTVHQVSAAAEALD